MKYRSIIFDFDKTLFTSKGLGKKSLKSVCFDLDIEFDETKYNTLTGYSKNQKAEILFPQNYQKILKLWLEKYSQEYLDVVEPYDGILEILKKIYDQGIKLFIFSAKDYESIEITLQKYNVIKYFDLIIGRDNVKIPKPDPTGIIKILESNIIDRKQIILIGDSNKDLLSAQNASIDFAQALWGTTDKLVSCNYLYTVQDIETKIL
jgi:HAD superfamily hydrolase (TIGR01549 family)